MSVVVNGFGLLSYPAIVRGLERLPSNEKLSYFNNLHKAGPFNQPLAWAAQRSDVMVTSVEHESPL